MNEHLKNLIRRYNELARIAKQPELKHWDHEVETLRARIVKLRATVRNGSLADAAAKLLCQVDHLERIDLPRGEHNKFKQGTLPRNVAFRTVGLSYREIERRLRERFPECLVTHGALRWYATKIRQRSQQRFAGLELPGRRPQRTQPTGS